MEDVFSLTISDGIRRDWIVACFMVRTASSGFESVSSLKAILVGRSYVQIPRRFPPELVIDGIEFDELIIV